MTPTPDFPDAPFGADTDEALSAFLDGELSAFATEHGTTAADARDRLEQWSGFAARIAALEEARAVAGAPVSPLDDLTRRRLVRNALPPSRPRAGRAGTWLTAAAAVVVVLIVVAIGALLVRSGDDGSSNLSSSAGTAAPEPRQGDLGNVGDVTDPAALRALLDPAGTKASSRTPEQAAGGGSNDRAELPAASAAPDANACARQLAGTRPVRFVGRGTYQGRPVVVVGITAGKRTIVLVVPAGDCTTVLTSLSR